MQLSVKGKQIDVGDALREHVSSNLPEVVGKYFGGSIDANVTFSREAHMFRADITVHVGRGMTLQSNASASEPYPAFDLAAERLSERLRRQKTRIKNHHKDNRQEQEEAWLAQSFVLPPDGGESEPSEGGDNNPVIVAETTTNIENLTVSEAVMRLDLGDLPALMFRNRGHGGLNMIYRRPDGHIGWVDPAASAQATALAAPAKAAAKSVKARG